MPIHVTKAVHLQGRVEEEEKEQRKDEGRVGSCDDKLLEIHPILQGIKVSLSGFLISRSSCQHCG